ncbi:hypothetical protein FRB94_012005 [Tulasnella sp. JGI-2019a]|nr:hypothetical protein FRB94_012005 [Tulasnella sp. JGI-2019a]KAG8995273.1 hypothetical protein FRB93_001167 [Tulasnella sp. JGI-2019a]KAG9024472.1 hypothetical protein FRB95_011454 [Tulasnella sp. JGI-2019a]
MMQQPTHQPPAHIAGGSGGMGGHQQIGNPFALGPISQLQQSQIQQATTESTPKSSADVGKDSPATNLRKRKTPPPQQADDDGDEEDRPQMPATHQLQPSMDDPPQPRMTAQQQSMLQQHAAAAAGHLHPPFPYQVPGNYIPVMSVSQQQQQQQQQQAMGGSPPSGGSQAGGSGPSRVLNGSKRAEQNRKAQRAFRERRDAHVKALESRSQLLEAALASVDEANRRWEESRQMCESLRLENAQLRAALNAFQQAGTAIVQMQQMAQQNQNQEEQQQAAAAAAVSIKKQENQQKPATTEAEEEVAEQDPDDDTS